MGKAVYKKFDRVTSLKTSRNGRVLAVVKPNFDPYNMVSLKKVPKTVFKDSWTKDDWSYVIEWDTPYNSQGNKDTGYGWLLEKNIRRA
jgi:hypothetical protein